MSPSPTEWSINGDDASLHQPLPPLNASPALFENNNHNNSTRPLQRRFRTSARELGQAAVIGILTGISVAAFKLSIETVRHVAYDESMILLREGVHAAAWIHLRAVMPMLGGAGVGGLLLLGSFPPGLRGTIQQLADQHLHESPPLLPYKRMSSNRSRRRSAEVATTRTAAYIACSATNTTTITTTRKEVVHGWHDHIAAPWAALRKCLAAILTLGTGCSLGPEGPCVEIGMSMARMNIMMMMIQRPRPRPDQNMLLLSCGAAAGVSAGFNAPISGVFFVLEVVQSAWQSIAKEERGIRECSQHPSEEGEEKEVKEQGARVQWMSTANITPILLASVLSALVARALLGNHLALILTEYSLKTPLLELPLYLVLGGVSGVVAFLFSQLAKLSNSFFAGTAGPSRMRRVMRNIPTSFKPIIGGLLCGVVGLVYPQVLFFGYETLNSLLANNTLSTPLVISLLVVKMIVTALSAGSGLVGGTFAPSLFLGAMTGAAFRNIVSTGLASFARLLALVLPVVLPVVYGSSTLDLADIPAYAMVGAASVLAALFRAPLTASLLLFELTRDYDVILPLMASAGVASLVGDILDEKWLQYNSVFRQSAPRDQDPVSWGDLSSSSSSSSSDDDETLRNCIVPATALVAPPSDNIRQGDEEDL